MKYLWRVRSWGRDSEAGMLAREAFPGGEEALKWCVVPLTSERQLGKVRVLERVLVPR